MIAVVSPDDASMLSLAIQLGSFGVLCYLIWWFTRVADPRREQLILDLQAKFLAALSEIKNDHREDRRQDISRTDTRMDRIESVLLQLTNDVSELSASVARFIDYSQSQTLKSLQ